MCYIAFCFLLIITINKVWARDLFVWPCNPICFIWLCFMTLTRFIMYVVWKLSWCSKRRALCLHIQDTLHYWWEQINRKARNLIRKRRVEASIEEFLHKVNIHSCHGLKAQVEHRESVRAIHVNLQDWGQAEGSEWVLLSHLGHLGHSTMYACPFHGRGRRRRLGLL